MQPSYLIKWHMKFKINIIREENTIICLLFHYFMLFNFDFAWWSRQLRVLQSNVGKPAFCSLWIWPHWMVVEW